MSLSKIKKPISCLLCKPEYKTRMQTPVQENGGVIFSVNNCNVELQNFHFTCCDKAARIPSGTYMFCK